MANLEENDILFAYKALNIMSGLTEATRRVAGAIVDHFNKRTGQCDPSIERLAAMLGISRATVIRATETLHELGLVQKDSHGGKAHRASYLPNWDHFRFIVGEWDARMKTGGRPAKSGQPANPAVAKVARLQRSQSQGCDVKGRTDATQTLRSNQSNKPIETARVETSEHEPPSRPSSRLLQGLWRGNRPDPQRSMLLPITGGRSASHADAAKGSAERRWLEQVRALGVRAEGDVIEWMNADRQDAAAAWPSSSKPCRTTGCGQMLRRERSWDTDNRRNSLYGRKWRNERAKYLAAHPFCLMCETEGKRALATVVDHVVPHRGDIALFWDRENWQSLCAHHHNSEKARTEIRGYSTTLGPDGWPIDPQHPANTGSEPISGKSRPEGLRRLQVPVFLVCGPQGAGKSTWCKQQMKDGDLLIDYDEIAATRYGQKRIPGQLFTPVFRDRNRMLLEAASRTEGAIYLPITGGTHDVRQWWKEALGNVTVVMVARSVETCSRQIADDPRRSLTAANEIEVVKGWWQTADFKEIDMFVADEGVGGPEGRRLETGHPAPNRAAYLVSGSEASSKQVEPINNSDDLGFA